MNAEVSILLTAIAYFLYEICASTAKSREPGFELPLAVGVVSLILSAGLATFSIFSVFAHPEPISILLISTLLCLYFAIKAMLKNSAFYYTGMCLTSIITLFLTILVAR